MGHKLNMMNVFLPPVLAFAVAGAVSILLIKLGVNIYIVSAAVLLIYAALMYILGIKEDDKQLIKSLFTKHTTSS
jgi:hypothetical protein